MLQWGPPRRSKREEVCGHVATYLAPHRLGTAKLFRQIRERIQANQLIISKTALYCRS